MQFIHELFRLFGDAPAQNDEIGPQQGMVFIENQIQFARPRVPAQFCFNLGASGGALFGLAPGDLQMPEFGVGYQPAIEKQCTTDTGAERQQQYRTRHRACGAVVQFRQPRCVCVVDGDDRPLQMLGGKLRQRLPNPRLVEIGSGAHDAVANHTGERQAHGVTSRNIRDHRGECAEQCLGRILRRRRCAEAFARESPGGQIDQRALNG
jgi:hypothetical protein